MLELQPRPSKPTSARRALSSLLDWYNQTYVTISSSSGSHCSF